MQPQPNFCRWAKSEVTNIFAVRIKLYADSKDLNIYTNFPLLHGAVKYSCTVMEIIIREVFHRLQKHFLKPPMLNLTDLSKLDTTTATHSLGSHTVTETHNWSHRKSDDNTIEASGTGRLCEMLRRKSLWYLFMVHILLYIIQHPLL
jgi:hypothetical protein